MQPQNQSKLCRRHSNPELLNPETFQPLDGQTNPEPGKQPGPEDGLHNHLGDDVDPD